ncbi:MAG: TatD family nuclease-associated radical SAM protein [Archangium sp.]|nr:TatD family nuclease-associated radical SAM protein [Archangium sp.]
MAIAYPYDGVLYLAATKRCTLACTFCPKQHGRWIVAGNDLRNDAEPSADELFAAAEALHPERFREVAFVGLGEPTMRLPVVVEVGRRLRAHGHRVRLVTDGLASLRAGHDVAPELAGSVDEVIVSLNAADPATYVKLCPNRYGEAAHAAACDFIRAARKHVERVEASVVAVPGLDLAACRRLAHELGVPLRERPWFDPLVGEPHEARA